MRVGTLRRGGRDGTLALISEDRRRVLPAPGGVPTFQAALDDWRSLGEVLQVEYAAFEEEDARGDSLNPDDLHAPLPRTYQWCEASSYLAHMERIRRARGMELPVEHTTEPIVYQAGGHALLGPRDPIVLPDPSWGLDCEGTIAVITDDVPLGTTREEAACHILFVVLTNDLTYRNLMPREYAKSVGPYQAKPTRPYAPVAVSTRSLGDLWSGRLLRATLKTWINGELLGAVDTDRDYAFDFAEIIEYVTRTRTLAAGTVVGSGSVSNRDEAKGFSCLAEKRAVEILATGESSTRWLEVGDTVKIEVFDGEGRSLFGALDQTIVDRSL